MNRESLVSVIIPVHNCERYLAEAIQSVMAQSYSALEVIVVDDGSTDASAAVANQFSGEVLYYYQERLGAAAARNQGINLAKGDFFSFLDSDDIWVPEKLKMQMNVLERSAEVDMVFGHAQQFHSPELKDTLGEKFGFMQEIMPAYIADSMLIRKDAFFHVGLFDAVWKLGEFIDWYLRAQEAGLHSVMLPDIVVKRRIHDGNMGIRDRQHRSDYATILKASLDRRRKREGEAL